MADTLHELMTQYAHPGRVVWLGFRLAKWQALQVTDCIHVSPDGGIEGDHYTGRSGNRQVTLIQSEHLDVLASMMGVKQVSPERVRRNIVVSEINLLALKGQRFRVGEALLEYTGLCHPCSRMEQELGKGGYNAMRGHGGITARVVSGGKISLHDSLTLFESE